MQDRGVEGRGRRRGKGSKGRGRVLYVGAMEGEITKQRYPGAKPGTAKLTTSSNSQVRRLQNKNSRKSELGQEDV